VKILVNRIGLATVSTAALLALLLIPSRTPVLGAPVEDGAGLFKAKCVACHGADASGNTTVGKSLKIKDLRSAEVQSQSDAQLVKTITSGKGKMPPYGKSLSPEQIQQLVGFIRSQARK